MWDFLYSIKNDLWPTMKDRISWIHTKRIKSFKVQCSLPFLLLCNDYQLPNIASLVPTGQRSPEHEHFMDLRLIIHKKGFQWCLEDWPRHQSETLLPHLEVNWLFQVSTINASVSSFLFWLLLLLFIQGIDSLATSLYPEKHKNLR